MKTGKRLLFGLIFLCLVRLTLASNSVTDILEEGQENNYNLDGFNYGVYVTAITDSPTIYVKFNINNILTPTLTSGQTCILNEGKAKLKINQLTSESCGDVMCDKVNFTIYLTSDCGNGICGSDEDCSTCSQDCACDSGYECKNGQCVEVIACGDDKCSNGETCEEDNCCSGIIVDLNNDVYNCGSCDNICYDNQTCTSGVCEFLDDYCGNGICESDEEGICKEDCKWCGNEICGLNENYINCSIDCPKPIICGNNICDDNESCCQDCGCDDGFECVDNACINLDECTLDSDCDDNNDCTQDICSGVPKECSHLEIEGCSNTNISEKSTPQLNTKQSSSVQDKIIENKSMNNKIKSTSEPKKIGLIQKIINWILGLFG